jgi:hypothetical protein
METSKRLISEEELIETVRRYSNLYDPADKCYHDILSKDNAWEEISAILKCPGKYQIIISINYYLIIYAYIKHDYVINYDVEAYFFSLCKCVRVAKAHFPDQR